MVLTTTRLKQGMQRTSADYSADEHLEWYGNAWALSSKRTQGQLCPTAPLVHRRARSVRQSANFRRSWRKSNERRRATDGCPVLPIPPCPPLRQMPSPTRLSNTA